jgi:hypothetical protein
MTPDDRDLLLSLRRQQEELQQTLARLSAQLGALEDRASGHVNGTAHSLPPLPLDAILPPIPPLADPATIIHDAPLQSEPAAFLPPIPPPAPAPRHSIEFHFGRWLMRIGALFGVIGLALIFAWAPVQKVVGHMGLLAISAGFSIALIILGGRIEGKSGASFLLGRTLTAMALAWLYLTTYAASSYEPVKVISSPLLGGILLVGWSLYTLLLAERKKSQTIGAFAIALAYISTAINPVGMFTMGADLLLAATGVVFLLRNGWTTVTTFSLIGTYAALLRRLIVDENGDFVFDTRGVSNFWPHAVYLFGAWLLFTAAGLLANAPTFRGPKRLAYISLNNFAVAALMALSAYVAGYGASAVGWCLIDTGFVFLITSRIAEIAEFDPVDVMGAYAAQGLALITGGIMIVYTGLTRAAILLVETFLLGIGAAFAGDRILRVSTNVSAFFATMFFIWEMAINGHHPWLIGFGGALVMFINAWACRGEVRNSPVARSTIVVSTSCYCILGLGLIYTALATELSDSALPPALALTALALTFSIYYFAIFELPPLAQTLLVAAQYLVLFPTQTGEELPAHTTGWVTVVTLLLITWWSRQRVTRTGPWTTALLFVYAAALTGIAHEVVRPYLDAPGWIVGASLLSFAFLAYGAVTRVWALAVVGQIFLALAVYHFFFPPNQDVFPWSWWVAATPVVVVLCTARAAFRWLRHYRETPEDWARIVRVLAYIYQFIALVAVIRWVFGVIPEQSQVAMFLLLGTVVLSLNVRHPSASGVRYSFLLSAIGVLLYLEKLPSQGRELATYLNALAVLLFLAQIALLRQHGRHLVTAAERWGHILCSSGMAWIFASTWAWTRWGPGYLTLSWALCCAFLFLCGALLGEKRLRWCGLGVVVAAILRVAFHDMWGLSTGYRALTIMMLAVITLCIGFMILRKSGQRTLSE